jgi:uncharacterized RmlC-like cupin family protein
MCAIRALPEPMMPAPANDGPYPGLAAVAVLPCPSAPTLHLAINLVHTEPDAVTVPHHHGELDTTLYVVRGTMAFHCGPGSRDSVGVKAGELAAIAPHAVHAEYNPDSRTASLGITARDTPGPFLFPCEKPEHTPGGKTGITVIPPPQSATTTATATDALGALGPHHLRVRRVALDRISLAPGAKFAPAGALPGEAALTVLGGAARILDAASTSHAASGSWWYLEPGTTWSLENPAGDATLEVLVVRSALSA